MRFMPTKVLQKQKNI